MLWGSSRRGCLGLGHRSAGLDCRCSDAVVVDAGEAVVAAADESVDAASPDKSREVELADRRAAYIPCRASCASVHHLERQCSERSSAGAGIPAESGVQQSAISASARLDAELEGYREGDCG